MVSFECSYLLATPAVVTSPDFGTRLILLGALNPLTDKAFMRDLDHTILTEILEFALSLVPVPKGSESFTGLPHLQAYKLVHAYYLAEMGETARAQRYLEAIAATMKTSKPSPHFHRPLLAQLRELTERLSGSPNLAASTSWMAKKMQRPTLDGVWGALEGSFAKFITGEDEDKPKRSSESARTKASIGPFSHYSAITPDAHSGGVSRAQSQVDFGSYRQSPPASRAGSALDFHKIPSDVPTARPASSMSGHLLSAGHGRGLADREASEISSDYHYGDNGYRSYATESAPWYGSRADGEEQIATGSSAYDKDENELLTPLAPDASSGFASAQYGGFSSASTYGSYTPAAPSEPQTGASYAAEEEDEEDDLGLGNASAKKAKAPDADDQKSSGDKSVSGRDEKEQDKNEKKGGEYVGHAVDRG